MSRSFKRHLTPADKRAKEVIKAAVEGGVGIDFITDAPRFRYVPSSAPRALFDGPPSRRGSVSVGSNPLKLRSWSPAKLSLEPMYSVGMAGDDYALTKARKAWAKGNPQPLRDYLSRRSAPLALAA